MRFDCPSCRQILRVDDSLAGRRGKCPKCGARVEVPLLVGATADVENGGRGDSLTSRNKESSASDLAAEVRHDNAAVASADETVDREDHSEDDRSQQESRSVGELPTEPASTVTKDVLDIPREFGRYRIRRLLGQGGMGSVYLADDVQLERPVALKIPREDAAVSEDVRVRFEREAKTAARLSHPNLCQVFDVGEWSGRQFLATEYVAGKPLNQFTRPGMLSDLQIVRIVHRIAVAMEAAHRQQVVHRDLKPSNVMLTESGEPKVMDFGLALRLDSADVRLTQSGTIVGTPAYMAKEQLMADREHIGPASDVYSLGVILYELLTGKLPYDVPPKAPLPVLLSKLLCGQPDPITKHRPDIDPRLQSILARTLAESLTERFRSMSELASELDAYLTTVSPDGSSITRRPIFDELSRPAGFSAEQNEKPVLDKPLATTIVESRWSRIGRRVWECFVATQEQLRHRWPEWQEAFRAGGNTTRERLKTLATRIREEFLRGVRFYREHRQEFWRRLCSGPVSLWPGAVMFAQEDELLIPDRARIEAVWDVSLPCRCVVCGIETDRPEVEQVRRLENFETTCRVLWFALIAGLLMAWHQPFVVDPKWWQGWFWIPAVMLPGIPIAFRWSSQEFASVRFSCCSEHAANTRYPELTLINGGLLVGVGSGRAKRRLEDERKETESERQSRGLDLHNQDEAVIPLPMQDCDLDFPSGEVVPATIPLVEEVEPTPILHADSTPSAPMSSPETGSLPLVITDSSMDRLSVPEDLDPEIPEGILIDDDEESGIIS